MIRPYHANDINELIDTWREATSIAHPFMNDKFLDKEEINIRNIYLPNTKTWVYSSKTGLTGFISMMGNEVAAIFVRPENQGHGIGRLLMNYVLQFHDELEVEVFQENSIGRAFYERYGFKLIKEHLHDETQKALLRLKFVQQ